MSDRDRLDLSKSEEFRLLEECRVKKEALHPNTRKIVLDLDIVREGLGAVTIGVGDYYERCRPLLDETLDVVDDLLAVHGSGEVEPLYVTAGALQFPLRR